jgi:hypothetical protein
MREMYLLPHTRLHWQPQDPAGSREWRRFFGQPRTTLGPRRRKAKHQTGIAIDLRSGVFGFTRNKAGASWLSLYVLFFLFVLATTGAKEIEDLQGTMSIESSDIALMEKASEFVYTRPIDVQGGPYIHGYTPKSPACQKIIVEDGFYFVLK